MRIAILALLASIGLAQEPAKKAEPKPKKEVLTEREWNQRWVDILGSNETDLNKLARIKKAAAEVLVSRAMRLVNVRPVGRFKDTTWRSKLVPDKGDVALVTFRELPMPVVEIHHQAGSVAITKRYGGRFAEVYVNQTELRHLSTWKPWDRIEWTVSPLVRGLFDVEALDMPTQIASMVRAENLGMRSGGPLLVWLTKFRRLKQQGRWAQALKMASSAWGVAFSVPASTSGVQHFTVDASLSKILRGPEFGRPLLFPLPPPLRFGSPRDNGKASATVTVAAFIICYAKTADALRVRPHVVIEWDTWPPVLDPKKASPKKPAK